MTNRLNFLFIILLTFISLGLTQTGEKGQGGYCILYIFPHPDDECYGPAASIDEAIKAGNQVHLLTLTKGGATQMRFDLNLTIEEMNEVRYKEMLNVEKALNLTSMTVLDYPDGDLKELDIRDIENSIRKNIKKIDPHIIVTYPLHGISTHDDHIVSHAAVKSVFLDLKDSGNNLRRLAFFGITEEDNKKMPLKDFKTIKEDEVDCIVKFSAENVAAAHNALDCYVTYKKMIENSKIKTVATESLPFDFYMESFTEPVAALTEALPDK